METVVKTNQTKIINRSCAACGKGIGVLINQDKIYLGGHYFGRLFIGKNEKAEYWECDRCFNE